MCAHVCARCAPAHVCARCAPEACCIPVNFISCITTECQYIANSTIPVNVISCITTECQYIANCTILWGQIKVCKFCMAASPCSCAPLPLAQRGPLLPAAGGRGLGGKVQAKRGGASSPLVTLNNNYFSLPPP